MQQAVNFMHRVRSHGSTESVSSDAPLKLIKLAEEHTKVAIKYANQLSDDQLVESANRLADKLKAMRIEYMNTISIPPHLEKQWRKQFDGRMRNASGAMTRIRRPRHNEHIPAYAILDLAEEHVTMAMKYAKKLGDERLLARAKQASIRLDAMKEVVYGTPKSNRRTVAEKGALFARIKAKARKR